MSVKNDSTILQIGALLGGLGVALGAFGAHAFNDMLTETGRLDTYQLAVRYQFYHALSLIATGILVKGSSSKQLPRAAWSFLIGCLLFCGSLYLLCFTENTLFAIATPFGGIFLLVGWIFLFLGVSKNKKSLH